MHLSQREKLHLLIYCYTIISTFIGMTCSTITLSPPVTDVVRYVNESYIVTCMDDAKQPVKWSRLKSNKAITDKGHPHLMRLSMGTALVFEQISADDRGQYSCKTDDDSATFKLIVISPITFMDTPSVQTAQEHHSTTIKCDVRGDPKPKILWKFDGRDISPPKYKIVQGGLEIKNVTLEDKGTYTCRAYQVSQVTSMFEEKGIRLNVQHKPMIPKNSLFPRENEAYGYLGGEVNLTCEAVAEPAANFTWFRQHKKTVIGRLIQRPHISTLQLFIQNDSLFGGYMCKATNKLGSLSQIITLQKGLKPPKPQQVKLRGATSDTLNVEVVGPDLNQTQIPPKMVPFGLRVQYRAKGESVKWSEAAVADFKLVDENERVVISGLNHNTDYELRVATRNIAGLSDFTAPLVGRTLGLQADSVTATAATTTAATSWAIKVTSVVITVLFVHA